MFYAAIDKEVKSAISEMREELRDELRQELKQEMKDSVEDICSKAISELFINENDDEVKSAYFQVYTLRTIGGKFKDRAIQAVSDDVDGKCRSAASELVSGEEFIDGIVARIKKKQILK